MLSHKKVRLLKEYTEKIVVLKEVDDGQIILQTAEEMANDGWFFLNAEVDSLLEKVYLFFERDITIE